MPSLLHLMSQEQQLLELGKLAMRQGYRREPHPVFRIMSMGEYGVTRRNFYSPAEALAHVTELPKGVKIQYIREDY